MKPLWQELEEFKSKVNDKKYTESDFGWMLSEALDLLDKYEAEVDRLEEYYSWRGSGS